MCGYCGSVAEQLPEHTRPEGVTDATVEALGRLSEAMETVEEARGSLYAFHRSTGTAHRILGDAIDQLRRAGHEELADLIERELLGRNVLQGRWTFQVVEEYDDTYYATFRALERQARDQLVEGRRHLYEAEMKDRKRTRGHPDHQAVPDDSGPQGDGDG